MYGNNTFSTLVNATKTVDGEDQEAVPVDLTRYADVINEVASQIVRGFRYGIIVPDVIKEFNIRVLSKIILILAHDDIRVARQLLASTLFDNYRSELTNILVFSGVLGEQGLLAGPEDPTSTLRIIDLLHEIKVDFNCFNSSGYTPLLIASMRCKDSVKILEKLIAFGADVNKPSKRGWGFPLELAVSCGNANSVEILLAHGANVEVCRLDYFVEDPKLVEDKKLPDYLQIIKSLVKAGVPVDRTDRKGRTLLKVAVRRGGDAAWSLVDLLISLGAAIYPELFEDAIYNGNEKLIRELLINNYCSMPEDIPDCGSNSSRLGGEERPIKLEIFQLCMRSGMSLKNFSLTDKVVLQTPNAVKDLLTRDRNLNIEIPAGKTVLFGGNPGEDGCLLAHFAAAYATRESLAILIHAGLNIHARDIHGLTPLHYAAVFGNSEAAKLLIFAGAEIDAVDEEGRTPLHWVVKTDLPLIIPSLDCARILLYAGAGPHRQDKRNQSPFSVVTAGYRFDKEEWMRAFKETTPRQPEHYKAFPSLKTLAIDTIFNTSERKHKLSYRNADLPDEVLFEIEEKVSQKLNPPPLSQSQ